MLLFLSIAAALTLRIIILDQATSVPSKHSVAALCIGHVAAGDVALTPPLLCAVSSTPCLQHAEYCRCLGTGIGHEEASKRRKKTALLLPLISANQTYFLPFSSPLMSDNYTTNYGKCGAGATNHVSLAASAAATAPLKCAKEKDNGTSSLMLRATHNLEASSRRFNNARPCCTFVSFHTFAPSSSVSPAYTSYGAPRVSFGLRVASAPRCRSSLLMIFASRSIAAPRPLVRVRPSGFKAADYRHRCPAYSPWDTKCAASLLDNPFASHIRSHIAAASRVLRAETSGLFDWLLRPISHVFRWIAWERKLPECAKIVNVTACRSIYTQLSVCITWVLADILRAVATHFATLAPSARAVALGMETQRACWLPAAIEAAIECTAATAAFWSTCAASLLLQRSLGVSCAARTCKLFGVATVFAASNAATGATTTLRHIIRAMQSSGENQNDMKKVQLPFLVAAKLRKYNADVHALHGTAEGQPQISISTLSPQQTNATQPHPPIIMAGEAVGAEKQVISKGAPLLPQKGVARGGCLEEAGKVGAQDEWTTAGVTRADADHPSFSSVAGICRVWCAPTEALQTLVKEGIFGCVVFWLLGGRFFRLSPSSLLAPGAYHQHHLSLRAGVEYATLEERRFIKKLGETFGCHTCGRRRGVEEWVADHQPPKSVVVRFNQTWLGWLYGSLRRSFGGTRYLPQRFYPQCKACSSRQATAAKHNASKSRGGDLIIKWSSLRLYHFTGGVLQFLRLLSTS